MSLSSILYLHLPSFFYILIRITLNCFKPITNIVLLCFVFRDRIRTVVNVMGDAYGAGIVNHLSRQELIQDANLDPNMTQLNEVNVRREITKEIN